MEHLLAQFSHFGYALFDLLTFQKILFIFLGSFLGLVVGAIPGLTATMTLALLINMTYGMELYIAIAFLLGVYVSAVMGGCMSAIMINIPGTPSSAATALDGFVLAKRGEGGLAIGTGVITSFFGMMVSILCLILFTPFVYRIALKFGQWEYFLLAVFGIMICGNLSTGKDPLKGWIVGFIGFFTAMIGLDQIYAFPRFTFGSLQLKGGISLIPALIGVFGISEVLCVLKDRTPYQITGTVGKIIPKLSLLKPLIVTGIRSGLIGVVIGAIPGAGEDIGAWVSYDMAKRRSKHPELFGKGSLEGVAAAETANNSVIGGAMIPLLTLAVPGSPPAAMFLAAVWLHGVRPGPMLAIEQPHFLFTIAISLFFASIAMLILGLSLAKPMVAILKIKREILMPVIVSLTVIGAYAGGVRIFDIYVMFFFGILGYVLRELDYPMAPLVLGIILGPMADVSFRRALTRTQGDYLSLLTRPIGIILLIAILFMIYSGVKRSIEYGREQARQNRKIFEGG